MTIFVIVQTFVVSRIYRDAYTLFCRYDLNFSLIMIDIDNFKKVTDSYGHETGEIVLKEVVRIAGGENTRGAGEF